MPSESGVTSSKQNVFDFAAKHAGLHRRTDCNNFVRVHALVRFLAEQFANDRCTFGNSCRSTDENNFVDVARLYARILQRLLAWSDRALKDVFNKRFELRRASTSGSGASDRLHRQ